MFSELINQYIKWLVQQIQERHAGIIKYFWKININK